MAQAEWILLARQLAELPEDQRLARIKRYAEEDSYAAAKVVVRCSLSRKDLQELTSFALRQDDLQRLGYWLESIAHRAGFRRLLRWIDQDSALPADVVDFAAYHLRRLVPDTDADRLALAQFCRTRGL
ncbi:MAG: hypothetical protein AAF799_01275 [Myxococcota bacterium]